MRSRPVVTIDGPSGAGKTTVSKRLADAAGFVRIDTGAMYRAVALAARRAGISWDDADHLGRVARELSCSFPTVARTPRAVLARPRRARGRRGSFFGGKM